MRNAKRHCILLPVLAAAVGAAAQTAADSLSGRTFGEAVVTGTQQLTPRARLPYSVSTITDKEIEATGRTQVLAALSGRIPGLFVSERNIFGFGVSIGGSGAIRVRGVGGSPTSGVLMMVDGQPQFAGIFSHPVADFYEADHVERVEVLRGPGSALYGSNAMGGVINVITKEAREEGDRTTLRTQYGSYRTWQSTLSNSFRRGRFSSLVSLGYDRTDGTQRHFGFDQKSLYLKLGYDFSQHWRMRADYSLVNFTGNDPVYARLSDPGSQDVYHQNVTRGDASLAVTNRYARTDGAVRVYYSYGNHHIDDPRRFHSTDDRLGLTAYQNVRLWSGAEGTFGWDIDTYGGRIPMSGGTAHREGSFTTLGRKSVKEDAHYVSLSQSLWGERLTLNAALRLSLSDKFGADWTPQGGLSLRPGRGWTVKASVAKGYRNPSFRELYLYRPANPDLEPERMINYEASVGKDFSTRFHIDLTAYLSKGSNMIQTVEMKNQNTGRFTNKGIELSAWARPVSALSVRASYSYLHTSLSNLTAAPKHQYYLGVAWQALKCLLVDAEMRGVGSLYVADDVDRQDYVLVNLKATWRVARPVELFVQLDNLTDARYEINRGYRMPGLTAMGGFKVRF